MKISLIIHIIVIIIAILIVIGSIKFMQHQYQHLNLYGLSFFIENLLNWIKVTVNLNYDHR